MDLKNNTGVLSKRWYIFKWTCCANTKRFPFSYRLYKTDSCNFAIVKYISPVEQQYIAVAIKAYSTETASVVIMVGSGAAVSDLHLHNIAETR